jgi:hypothetical protein
MNILDLVVGKPIKTSDERLRGHPKPANENEARTLISA